MTAVETATIIIIVVLSGVLGFGLGKADLRDQLQNDAAQTERAQFSPETGEFEWLPKELKK